MPQEAEFGQRFARDLRRIREAQNLTINDLHEETKIPVGLIETFEDRALFDHPQFNRVYLRSFVRTYAQVVGLDSDRALDALEEALAGTYAGSLAADYLGEVQMEEPPRPGPSPEEGDVVEAPPSGIEEWPAAPSPRDHARREQPDEGSRKGPEAEAGAHAGRPRAKRGESGEREERGPADRASVEKGAVPPAAAISSEAPSVQTQEDWSIQSPPSGTRRRTMTPTTRREGPDRRWVVVGVAVVAVAVLAWILISVLGDSDDEATSSAATTDTVQTADTAAAEPVAAPVPPVEVPALGDSMSVRILAARGKLDPIRVTVDDDLRRPYWIEQGDSMTFRPTQRIVIEELLENIDLKVEGITYPTSVRDDLNRIVITRDSVQSHFATLQRQQ